MCFVLLTVQNRHEAFRSPDSLRKAFLLSCFSFRLHMPDGNQTDVRFFPPGNNQRDRCKDLLHVRHVLFLFHALFPSCSLLILCSHMSQNSLSISHPRYFLPARIAATAVVPLPMNGSNTVCPSSVNISISFCTSSDGFCVG
mgnify:CR=1 FL=1